MSETRFTGKVVKKLRQIDGVMAINVHGSTLQIGQPDILGSYHGLAFAIETKSESGKLSLVQESVRRKWEAAGTEYFVIRTWNGFDETIARMERKCRQIEMYRDFHNQILEPSKIAQLLRSRVE